MSIKHKPSKEELKKRDQAENRKFLMVLAVATVVLMLLMYFAFVRG